MVRRLKLEVTRNPPLWMCYGKCNVACSKGVQHRQNVADDFRRLAEQRQRPGETTPSDRTVVSKPES